MERMPEQPCWEGRHWLFAIASVVTIGLLYPVMIYFERKRQSAAEVSYHVHFTSCMVIGKLALSGMSALLVSSVPPSAYLLCCGAMLVGFLHVNNQREHDDQPACCNVTTVRLLRSMNLTCALWSVTVALASTVLDRMPSWSLLLVLGVLWTSTMLLFLFLIIWPEREPAYRPEPVAVKPMAHRSFAIGWSTGTRRHDGPPGSPRAENNASQHHHQAPTPAPPALLEEEGSPLCLLPPSRKLPPPSTSVRAGGGGGGGGGGDGGGGGGAPTPQQSRRTVYLPALVASRPRVTFYEFDDGFDALVD
jgi:uncharacterized membrane protein YgcG